MAYKLIYFLVLISSSSIYAQKNECNLNNFRTSGIVPNKLSSVPAEAMKIEYDGVPVTCGNLLSRKVTHDPPTVVEYKADKSKLYTLIMFDPDVTTPQNPDVADFRHWLVENIPGDDVKSGDMISPYFPTNPAPYSDAHRYTFVVYEQPEGKKLNDNFPNKPNKRTHFDLNKFIEDRNLQGPIAGNFFYLHY
ncbi:protein D2-like [Argiope bruennichi]|uniref:protein D2-like n=1 Tax=Argiope bruennichi TaxID=94029 RepID=UPI0024941D5F|nr:protein D2-like [Argiope bruennichi]